MEKEHTTHRTLALLALAAMLLAAAMPSRAQVKYETFIYTNDAIGAEIQELSAERAARGSYAGELLHAATDAGKGIAAVYVTSVIDLGVNAIASLITRPSRLKK